MGQPSSGITERMPEHYDVTLLDPDNKLGRDIAIIFSTAIITTIFDWWFLAR